jgi:phosphoglucosamine mutase
MSLKFGTDGVRGPADELTDELVVALGTAAGRVLGAERFVVGRDPRESGPRLDRALRRGIEAAGVAVDSIGVVPTPAVACLAARDGVAGAVISASHNPFGDNGIKFFAPGGLKLTDAVEEELEAELERILAATDVADAADTGDRDDGRGSPAAADESGDDRVAADAAIAAYRDLVVGSLEGRDLAGLRVVIDCANGASSVVAPAILRDLGVDVEVINDGPDGRNINEGCGSTHPEALQAAVVAADAQIGLAFDGDADRVLAVDEQGRLVDGDELIALCAIDLRERGALAHDTVVVTVMTNLGFHLGMARHGVTVAQTQVGDRYVLEALEAGGFVLGGEQSGHVIFRALATTGDGLLTGVQLLDLLRRSGRPLSELVAGAMERLPQVLVNVRVAHRDPDVAQAIVDEIADVEATLGETGRVLVRPSGTEPLVRVMVEAPELAVAEAAADRLVGAVVAACGAAADEVA